MHTAAFTALDVPTRDTTDRLPALIYAAVAADLGTNPAPDTTTASVDTAESWDGFTPRTNPEPA